MSPGLAVSVVEQRGQETVVEQEDADQEPDLVTACVDQEQRVCS